MGVRDSTDIRKAFVQLDVGRQIARGAKLSIDNLAVQIGDNDVLRSQFFIRYAAGLDGDQPLFAIDAAGIAERIQYESAAHQLEVGLKHLVTQCLQQHSEVAFSGRVNVCVTVNDNRPFNRTFPLLSKALPHFGSFTKTLVLDTDTTR